MRLEEVMGLLRALPLFAPVSAEALRLLAFSATSRSYRAGDTLFRRGEMAEGALLITAGEVVLDQADNGSPANPAFGVGTLLGQSALFAPVERPATAIARSVVGVHIISRELMAKVIDAHPESAAQLQAALARQNAELAKGLERVMALPGLG